MSVMNSLMMTASGAGSACPELEGTMWTWGSGAIDYLGHGNTTNYDVPTQIGSGTNWTNKVSPTTGSSRHMIKTDGTLWAYGEDYNGTIGNGANDNQSAPIQIGSDTDWAFVYGTQSVAAIKTDGSLYTWGYNVRGQLGHGNTTNLNAPAQVGSDTDWAVAATHTSANFFIMLKTDGTMYSMGFNNYGQLGLGDTTQRDTPVQIGSATNWIAIDVSGRSARALASV
jgi:alpha-tubulin suppressor-like RCC1 family protein